MEHWYAVFTKPRQEQRALENLVRQGYHTFLPKIRSKRILRGKYLVVVEPLFSRYLFVRCDLEQSNSSSIRSTFGVSGLVRFGEHIPDIPDAFVEELLERTDCDAIDEDAPIEFKPGQTVRIETGPLAGTQAIFQGKSGEERALLLLDILGRQTRAQVRIDSLSSP